MGLVCGASQVKVYSVYTVQSGRLIAPTRLSQNNLNLCKIIMYVRDGADATVYDLNVTGSVFMRRFRFVWGGGQCRLEDLMAVFVASPQSLS